MEKPSRLKMKDLIQLATEIEDNTGIRLDDDIIQKASVYLASSNRKPQGRPNRHHGHCNFKMTTGDGDAVHGLKNQPNDHFKEYSTSLLIKEFEKISSLNKSLQTNCIKNDDMLQKLNDKVLHLKYRLADESENTIKLVADRERLKLEIEDSKRKFHTVLLLSGINEKDVTHFLQKNPKANEITDEMVEIKEKMKKYIGEKQNKYDLLNPAILSKRNQQLEEYNEKLNSTNHDRINALKDDIHSMMQDNCKIVDGLTDRTKQMAQRLSESNEVLHLILVENLKLKSAKAEIEASFDKERKKLLGCLSSNNIDQNNFIQGPRKLLDNATTDASVIKNLQNLLSRTQNDLLRRENEVEALRTEFLKMEKKIGRINLEKEEFKKLYEVTLRKMNDKNAALLKRSENVDERRKLEGAGFRSDIQELRRFIADLEKKLNFCLCKHLEKRMLEDIGETEFFRNTVKACTMDETTKRQIIHSVQAKQKRVNKYIITGDTKNAGSKITASKLNVKPCNYTSATTSTRMKAVSNALLLKQTVSSSTNVRLPAAISKETKAQRSGVYSKSKERKTLVDTALKQVIDHILPETPKFQLKGVQSDYPEIGELIGNENGPTTDAENDCNNNTMANIQKLLDQATHRLAAIQNNIKIKELGHPTSSTG